MTFPSSALGKERREVGTSFTPEAFGKKDGRSKPD